MVPTLEEIANKVYSELSQSDKISVGYMSTGMNNLLLKAMRTAVELHREECLKQAAQKAKKQHVCTGGASYYIVNKDSILNAYSKKNIR